MKPPIVVRAVARHPDILGEAPAYDANQKRLIWVDIVGQCVHQLRLTDDSMWRPGNTWHLGRPVSAVVPRSVGGLLVAAGCEFLALSESGAVETLASLAAGPGDGIRFNDAKCDPWGRFLAGWMSYDTGTAGALVRLDPDGAVETILPEVGLSNGLDWSPDGQTFYFADSLTRRVDAFDYDQASGTITNRRPFVSVEPGTAPNGLAVDDDGFLWLVLPFVGELRRYSPEGAHADSIHTPTVTPTSCAFGGPDRNVLFITSASFSRVELPKTLLEGLGIPADRLGAAKADAEGGALFSCEPGATGPAATPFAG